MFIEIPKTVQDSQEGRFFGITSLVRLHVLNDGFDCVRELQQISSSMLGFSRSRFESAMEWEEFRLDTDRERKVLRTTVMAANHPNGIIERGSKMVDCLTDKNPQLRGYIMRQLSIDPYEILLRIPWVNLGNNAVWMANGELIGYNTEPLYVL